MQTLLPPLQMRHCDRLVGKELLANTGAHVIFDTLLFECVIERQLSSYSKSPAIFFAAIGRKFNSIWNQQRETRVDDPDFAKWIQIQVRLIPIVVVTNGLCVQDEFEAVK